MSHKTLIRLPVALIIFSLLDDKGSKYVRFFLLLLEILMFYLFTYEKRVLH